MLKFEFEKVFCKKKIWVIFSLCILAKILFSMQMKTVMFDGFHSKVYRYYIDRLEGPYTSEKKQWMENEYEKMQELEQNADRYEEQYKQNELSAEEFRRISNDIKSAQNRILTVEYLVEKGAYSETLGEEGEYFYDIEVMDYVEHMEVDVFVVLLLILLLTPLFTEDDSSGTVLMVRSSMKGRRELFWRKFVVVLVSSAAIGTLFPCLEFFTKYMKFDLGNLEADIKNLLIMKDCGLTMSIRTYLILTIVSRGFYGMVLGVVIMFFASLSHKNMTTYVLSVAYVYLPKFLSPYMGQAIKDVSLCQGLGAYDAFSFYHEEFGIPGVWFGFLVSVLMAMVMVFWCERKSEKAV